MGNFEVVISEQARYDLRDIYEYIGEASGFSRADNIHERIINKCESLENFPYRGRQPNDARALGLDLRQVNESVYRILYDVGERTVEVLAVIHEKRDLQALLKRRFR